MLTVTSTLAAALYLITTILIFSALKRRAAGDGGNKRFILGLWATALLCHSIALYYTFQMANGINLAFFNALSIVAFLIAALLWISSVKQPMENLGIGILPIAALVILLDLTLGSQTRLTESSEQGLQIHILISLLAYSVLSIAALQAILLAIQERQLHNHKTAGLILALPALQLTERLLFRIIGLGFILLSLALLSGFLFLDDIFAQRQVHKTVLSIAAWLVFATLLWGRWQFGWRGRTAIRWTLGGFFSLMLAYFGSKLVIELILHNT